MGRNSGGRVVGTGFRTNMQEESHRSEAELCAVGEFFAGTRGNPRTVYPGSVAAVEVGDGDAISADAEEAVSAAYLRRGQSEVAFGSTTDDDVVANGDLANTGGLVQQFKNDLHGGAWRATKTNPCGWIGDSFLIFGKDFKNFKVWQGYLSNLQKIGFFVKEW